MNHDTSGALGFVGVFGILGILLLLFLGVVALVLYPGFCFFRIARKSNTEPAWLAWIPIANLYLICKLGNMPWWWMLLCFIPFAGPIIALVLLSQVPKCLGVTDASRFLIIIPFVNFFYIGHLAFRTEPGAATAIAA
jgi:hypothetical protein